MISTATYPHNPPCFNTWAGRCFSNGQESDWEVPSLLRTYYLLDATGNVMCIYTRHGDTLTAGERPIYGSKRLGELRQQIKIGVNGLLLNYHTATIGFRHYELTDHLGNVMAVVSDRKTLSTDSMYIPDVIFYTDYYPFGFPMESRSWQMEDYRYGFNGQESDNEVYGEKQSYTAEFWQYDSRLGRRWNVDPVFKEYESPYACFAGNPIWFVDIFGNDTIFSDDQVRKDFLKAYNKVNNTISDLESEIQGYKDKLSSGTLNKHDNRVTNRKKETAEAKLKEWNKLKSDFTIVLTSPVVFHYDSKIGQMLPSENGLITIGTTYGSGENMTGDVYISIRPGCDDYVIHEDWHCIQILTKTDKRPVLEVEREAYLRQMIYNPQGIYDLIENTKKTQYPDLNTRPEFYDLDDTIKYLYKKEIEAENGK